MLNDPHLARVMAAIEAKRDGAIVQHVCPECGGEFASHIGAFAIVQSCWACGGTGLLTADQLDGYLTRSLDKNSGLDITG